MTAGRSTGSARIMNTPDIGLVVVRIMPDGIEREDWMTMRRIDHGPNSQDVELGVLCWGSDGARHKPGIDRWRSK